MKQEFLKFTCLAFALFLSASIFAQNDEKPVNNPSPVLEAAPVPPPPPPPPPELEEEMVFRVCEEMPRFPGCEDQNLKSAERSKCSKEAMFTYIQENLVYPAEAKQNGVEGSVVIQFRIDKKGKMYDLKIVRELSDGSGENSCAKAAMDLMTKMKNEKTWSPGKQRGRPILFQYTLPIKFKI